MYIRIKSDNRFHIPGSTFTGCLNIKITSPSNIHKIEMRFFKRFFANHSVNTVKNLFKSADKSSPEEILYSNTFILYENPSDFNEMSCGSHTFPFEIKLSERDRGSVDSRIFFDSEFYVVKNQYFLEAIVYRKSYGKFEKFIKTLQIYMVDNFEEEKPKKVKLDYFYCFCLIRSSFWVEAILNKSIYFSGETAKLKIELGGFKCKINVKNIIVILHQFLEVEISSRRSVKTKTISKTKGYSDLEGGSFLAEIRIPYTVPSNVSEEYLKLKNTLSIIIFFDKLMPVKLQKNINLVKNTLEDTEEEKYIDLIQGIREPVKFFEV